MRERCQWKDVTSGIVIYLIWVEHLGDYNPGNIRTFIGLFANPVFFMIAGFFAQTSELRPIPEMIKKNAVRLLLPYYGWGIINVVYYTLLNGGGIAFVLRGIVRFLQCDLTLFEYGGSSWFLIGLFEARVLYDLMRRRINNQIVLCSLLLLINLIMTVFIAKGYPVLNTGYLRGIYWSFFYSLGPLFFPIFNRIKRDIQEWRTVQKTEKLIFGLLLLILTIISAIFFLEDSTHLVTFGTPFVNVVIWQDVLPLIFSTNLIWMTLFVKWNFWERIGKNTLLFCVGESIIKSLASFIIYMVGLSLRLDNAVTCLMYVFCIYWIADKCLTYFSGDKKRA